MIVRSSENITNVDINLYNYYSIKKNLDDLFSKYRMYKEKKDIITKRLKSSLSLDNLGIFSSNISDPTSNKVEQIDKYNRFIETIDKTYDLFSNELTEDEKKKKKKTLLSSFTDNDVMEMLCLNSPKNYMVRKKSCYIKVARWFDLEEFNDKYTS